MIPLIPEYIKRVDLESKTIEVENAKGLILWE
jgi:ribosomal 30S subunit maturation factor RimM